MSNSRSLAEGTTVRAPLALLAIVSLVVALFAIAAPVFAGHTNTTALTTSLGNHENPCPEGSTAFKIDAKDIDADGAFHTYTTSGFSVQISAVAGEGEGDAIESFTFQNANPPVVRVTTKAGSEQSTEPYEDTDFPGGATSGTIGPREDEKNISFVIFCVGAAQQTEAPTDSPTPPGTPAPPGTPTPPESPTPPGTPTPPGGTGGELGSTGRPGGSTGGGTAPNTATDAPNVIALLSIALLVGSLGALALPAVTRRSR